MSKLHEYDKLTNFILDCQSKIIIEETCVPRSRWKISQVEEFAKSKDGFNCGCKLHVIGKQGLYFIKRSVNKLYPLENENLENSVVKDISQNDDVIDYDRANKPNWLVACRETEIDSKIE